MTLIRRLVAVFALLLAAGGLAAIYTAPYLPRLVTEGYPQPRWPAPGIFALMTGNKSAQAFASHGRLNGWSLKLLKGADGKALLVHHDGKLALAHYAADVSEKTRFNSYSLAKSLIGALMLKAVAEGRISSLDDPIGKYLPNVGDKEFRLVPLRAFATRRSGIIFEPDAAKSVSGPDQKDIETFRLNPFGPMARLHMSSLIGVAADLRTVAQARATFSYQNINTALLGAILERVYAKPLEAVLVEKIWRPANAARADWRRYGEGLSVTPYCCIYATPSDWLRVGVYLMRNGTRSDPFLREDLWRQLFGKDLAKQKREQGHYGLHIYHNVLDRPREPLQGPFTYMFGSRGQVVYMMPSRDLVVVRFGEKKQLLHSTLYAAWRSMAQK